MEHYSKEDILSFLKTKFIMEIATCNNNKPAASVLLYAIDDDFNFYFGTHVGSYKAKNLLANPQISLSVWDHEHMLVQVDGLASQVVDPNRKNMAMDMLADSVEKGEDFWPPLFRFGKADYIIFSIKPTWLRALDLEVKTMKQEDSPFTEIIFTKNDK